MFWLASVVLLSWPLRVFVQYKIAYVHYYIHKVFGVVGGPRDTSMANSSSDVTVANNNTLIPSYSEAMRMDQCGRTESTELLTCHRDAASSADVELGPQIGSAALVPLLRGFRRTGANDQLSVTAVGADRTVYGTVVHDRVGRAVLRSSSCRPSHLRAPASGQSWSSQDGERTATHGSGGLRSRRREGGAVQKRKRRRSYNQAVGVPSGSEVSLAVNTVDSSERVGGPRRGRTSSAGRRDAVRGMATSVSTPETFDKLQKASAWVEQLRHVKSFVEDGIRATTAEADVTVASADHSAALTSTGVAVGPGEPPASAHTELAQSAYDVVGRRVVRCQQDWIVVDDDDDDDLPPSYEDALRMRMLPYDVHLDDMSSVSTTSTYLSSELGVSDTPRRWKMFVRRPYGLVDLPLFHVETSL